VSDERGAAMRKDTKKTSRKQAKKADVKDLGVKDSRAVKGGKVSVQDFSFTQTFDKASPTLLR
jgi:type VI protein secretion system component Hcp